MNIVDACILRFFNHFSHHWELFDLAVGTLASSSVAKTGLIAVFWWMWFRPNETITRNREIIVATLASACLCVAIGRLLASLLPFRLRPIHASNIDFILPYGSTTSALRDWSSFPSDHAMVFFAMATGVWLMSRRLGALIFVYVLFLIALPRVYMGLHYPTDIIAGAVFGIVFACVANLQTIRTSLAAPVLNLEHRYPGSFYTFFFLFSEGVSTMFDSMRHLAIYLIHSA